MMDKRTLWVVVACIVALFGWQILIGKLYPPKPRPLRPVVGTIDTNVAPAPVERAATNATAEIRQLPPPEPEAPRPPEKLVVLSNEFVRAEFTSWGGGIRSLELLKYKANGYGNIVLNSPAPVPALALTGIAGDGGVYDIEKSGPTSVVMRARLRSGTEIVKQISLGSDYLLRGEIRIVPPPNAFGAATQNVAIVIGEAAPATPREQQQVFLGVDWLAGGKYQNRSLGQLWKNAARGLTNEHVQAQWAAVKSQFFAMILTPATESVAIHYGPVHLAMPAGWESKAPPDGVSAALEVPPTAVTNAAATYTFTYYAGPKEYDGLVALGKGQEDVMQFGFWGVISVWLLKSMKLLYQVIPNYGVAIIIITILIKLVFWPIQAKSIRSMKEMQKFQPLMNKLREKYKDDPQRMQQETMKLYKEHKVNPFSGCLPMLVQIPVFFALYAMLRSAIELRGAHFLWIHDLSQPDTIAHLVGFPINPLPLLMCGSMVWQMKVTPTGGDPKQQQMMMLLMPVMMLWFLYSASSGLSLYWTVQQLLSIAQQWWSLRQGNQTSGLTKPVAVGKST